MWYTGVSIPIQYQETKITMIFQTDAESSSKRTVFLEDVLALLANEPCRNDALTFIDIDLEKNPSFDPLSFKRLLLCKELGIDSVV
jgi:hypothetical protein